PDNRRSVNYELRKQLLNELESRAKKGHKDLLQDLWKHRYSGKIKLWLVHTLLNDRRENEAFFANADYLPLTVEGDYASHVLAFARRYNNQWLVVAVPLHIAILCNQQAEKVLQIDWKHTSVLLPENAPFNYRHLFSQEEGTYQQAIAVGEIFKSLPLAVLKLK
ncbi:MAG: malto-oligosyltrehalose synthase, partial [Segetibacter sp.]